MPTRPADPIGDLVAQRPPMELMLGCLPAQHQEILVETYFRHRTIHEAARQLGLAPRTARARLYQAMSDLSDMVATDGRVAAPAWPTAVPVDERAGRGRLLRRCR
jgi:DNA-directed RNA polymerase specialized sigma24 family protein